MDPIIEQLAKELDKQPQHVENVVRLLDEGNTIPFIARYRKELHGAMDDTSLRTLEERLKYLRGPTPWRTWPSSSSPCSGAATPTSPWSSPMWMRSC